ncbi:Ig-like domain-containing protein [Methanoculleus sp.]|uniref:Ig-like domain-containing protein n=1 Tax=Methanoculleus sp. TaxID=90427 RepID=UPI0025E40FCC|nr:Ig-like domain-containing protein [Methanoculleus sp.]MCK9319425.1 Ig-like domain-containing protein [Methanoculleus sp.]
MGVNQNTFVPTVGNVLVRDVAADSIVLRAKTLVNSSINVSTSNTEISGGEFSQLLYDYNYARRMEVSMSDARFDIGYIALNVGNPIQNQLTDVWQFDEDITLGVGGAGTVTGTPVGKVYVFNPETGSVQTVTPTGSNISIPALANKAVKVSYKKNETIDMITIDADTFPKTYELTIEVKVYNADGHCETIQYIFPQWKPSGSFEISLASESPTTSNITGKVLATSDQVYGYVKIIPVTSTVTYTTIASSVGEVAIEVLEDYTLTTFGLRGGNYSPVVLAASSCTYASSDQTKATVSATGVITGVAEGSSYITIEHQTSGLTDVVEVTVTA